MKKFIAKIAAITLAIASTATLATEVLTGVAGYDPAGGSTTTLTPSAVKDGGAYTIRLQGVIGVSFDALKGLTPYAKAMDAPTKKQVNLYNLPDGTIIYAMGLGREWGEMSEDLGAIPVDRAKAKGTITGGSVTLPFTKGTERCRVVTWTGVLPDGQRVWGSHPESGWNAKNVNGSPRTAWCFKGDTVVTMDQPTKLALAGKK